MGAGSRRNAGYELWRLGLNHNRSLKTMDEVLSFVKKDWYSESFKVYIQLSDERETHISCLQRHMPKALKQLPLPQNKSRFSILSVGAGDGEMDQEVLKIVQGYLNVDNQLSQEVKMLNTAVEPHSGHVQKYKEFISRRPKEERTVVEFDLKPVTFEEYAKTKHEPNQYDMVHAIHSLYFVDNLEATLNHCYYNELGEVGLIACFLCNNEFLMKAISEITNQSREGGSKKETFRTSAEIVAVAEKNAWKFEIVDCPSSINVTEILRHNSDEGNLLLDFLALKPAFRQSSDQEMVASVLELLQNRSSEDEDGRLLVKGAIELILIYKS